MRKSTFSTLLLSATLLLNLTTTDLYATEIFEQPGEVSAAQFLSSEVMKGKYHQVQDIVENDGFLNSYRVDSDFGEFRPTSNSSLRMLITEISAIAEMKKVETDDTAIEAFKQSGKNTYEGLKHLFNEPEETFENAKKGVSGLFNRAKETVGKREVTHAEDTRVEQLIGYTKAKGEIATKYGVNLYSSNPVLQQELDRLAIADYLGGLGVGVATSVVPGVGGLVLTTSGTARLLNEAINSTPAAELWRQNKNKLIKIGISEGTAELFLNNPHFTPALQTVLTEALGTMEGVQYRDLFISVSLQADSPQMAKAITETVVLTSGYNTHITPLKAIEPLARLTKAITKDGTTVIVLPADYIIWSKKFAELISDISVDKAGEIWSLGSFSPLAMKNLETLGWKVHGDAQKILVPLKK